MKSGMLWFDNDTKTSLIVKVQRAAEYFREKYGKVPNVCFVHPSMLVGTVPEGGISIRPYRPIMPNHLWIGVEE